MFRKTLQLGAGIALGFGLICGQAGDLTAQDDGAIGTDVSHLNAGENPYTTAYDVRIGSGIFERSCSRCHGLDGTGGERGPDLTSGFQPWRSVGLADCIVSSDFEWRHASRCAR